MLLRAIPLGIRTPEAWAETASRLIRPPNAEAASLLTRRPMAEAAPFRVQFSSPEEVRTMAAPFHIRPLEEAAPIQVQAPTTEAATL